jgi:hypothetical protein
LGGGLGRRRRLDGLGSDTMAGIYDAVAANDEAQPKPKKVPGDFDSQEDFLADMRQKYEFGYGFNEHNIIAGKEDAKFTVGNQWDPVVEQRRKNAKKPVLTFNRLVAFVAQIVGNRLMNETEIRVHPDKAGTKEIAEIREGLIRNIFKQSNADFARDEAHKYQVVGGQGAYCLGVDYVNDDVFEQEIKIKAITDPYSVVLDPLGIEPSGQDCQWGFVGDDIPQQEFKKRWPWAADVSFMDEKRWNQSGFWMQEDTVRIVSFWRMTTEGKKILALYKDGTIHDVSDMEEFEYLPYVETRKDGEPYIREVPKRFARLYICSGNAILEGPYDYPVSSLPIYRVPGWELNDGERIHRWGLIRFLKDPQRLHNYWRSTVAEQLVAAPRNKWLTTPDAVKGHEVKWRRSPSSDDPFLYYNDGEQTPTHIPPPGIDAALVNEAAIATQDMKDISNIHEAALGMPSNEVSKVAIQQRQMVSDVGTFIYTDRLRTADERCAYNINELISYIYDTTRTVTIIGRDDKATLQVINDPSNPNSDMSIGKYAVSVSVGPASETKRTLAAEQMMAFVNAAPQTAANVMDLVAEAQDWPKSGEFARRFKMMLPAGMIPADEMTPEMQQMQQQNQQLQEAQAMVAQKTAEAEIAKKTAEAANAEARARLAEAQAYKAVMDAQSRQLDVQGKNDERETRAVLDTFDHHNRTEAEDRDFDLREQDQQHRQETAGIDQFAGLAQQDRDFQLREEAQRNAAENPMGGNNGESK